MNNRLDKPIQKGDALLVVDVQNDFCPGGRLPVAEGDQVVPVLNGWIEAAAGCGASVIASRDWHPPQHMSFREQGGPWPEHCVRGTPGAEFHPQLQLPPNTLVIDKGTDNHGEGYSAFERTGLADHLRQMGVNRLWVGGLAQDFCVKASVVDACRAGFQVHLIRDATRPVDPSGGRGALEQMQAHGAVIHSQRNGGEDL